MPATIARSPPRIANLSVDLRVRSVIITPSSAAQSISAKGTHDIQRPSISRCGRCRFRGVAGWRRPGTAESCRGEQLSAGARSQIEALVREKAARSKGRRKMDSQLVYGIKMQRREPIAEGVNTLTIRMPRSADGSAIVDITADVTPELLRTLRQAGARILGSYPESHSLRAEINLD